MWTWLGPQSGAEGCVATCALATAGCLSRAGAVTGHADALAGSLQEEWPQCPSVQQLQKNLGQERAAVFTFMYSTCDEVRGASCLLLLVAPALRFL